MKKIISIVGARPQFIKHFPVHLELRKKFVDVTIHTGQHYDENMSAIFFEELGINHPDYIINLQNKTGNHSIQTAEMMIEIDKITSIERPDIILVYGDTNSTLAASLVAFKKSIPVIHIESGLRSYNNTMPEEINRVITDKFSNVLFCPSEDSVKNLSKEGINHKHIYISGDVMKDAFYLVKNKIAKKKDTENYIYATIHRPYNTDIPIRLQSIMKSLNKLPQRVIFPIHPRTKSKLINNNIDLSVFENISFIEPCGYIDNLRYQLHSTNIITDSGGIQKEAYFMKKKCITIRPETEWIETLEGNWNELVFDNLNEISTKLETLPNPSLYQDSLYGNGKASEFIAKTLYEIFNK